MNRLLRIVVGLVGVVLFLGSVFMANVMAEEDPTLKPGFYPAEYLKKKNPLPLTLQTLQEGRKIYMGHCEVCHGARGDGQGDAAIIAKYDPMPRNFTDSELMKKKTDGMLFYSVTRGVHGTMMIPREIILNEDQRWAVIWYVRTFAKLGE